MKLFQNLLKVAAVLAIAVTVAGCGCGKHCRCAQDFQRDSVYIHTSDTTLVRDTLILYQIPEGSASVVVSAGDTAKAQTSLAEARAWVDHAGLHVSIRNRSEAALPLHVPYYVNVKESLTTAIRESAKTIYKEKPFTRWQSFRIVLGDITLILLCLAVAAGIAYIVIKKPAWWPFGKK